MLKRMRMTILALLMLWTSLGAGAGVSSAAAQTAAQDEQAVTRAVIDLLRAQGEGDVNYLYDMLVPEARNVLPRQAFVNWYAGAGRMIPVGEPEITSITFDDWESDLSGDIFRNTALVEYTVAVADGMQDGEMALWNDGQVWRWFFTEIDGDLDAVARDDAWSIPYESPYRTEMFRNIDIFWAQMFANAGLEYQPPVDMVGVVVEPTQTGCGPEDNIAEMAVYYCTRDQTIYYDPDFRDLLVDSIGEYAWDHVVAHEWGHHIQNLLGVSTSRDPELQGGLYTIEHELQADCLSGIFGQDAYARGIIRSRDINDAVDVISVAGDSQGTSWDDATAHGSATQREQSFWTGYDDGLIGCHIEMQLGG